jgi:hypothetical protein
MRGGRGAPAPCINATVTHRIECGALEAHAGALGPGSKTDGGDSERRAQLWVGS